MGTSGVKLDISVDKLIESLCEHDGNIKTVAMNLGCSRWKIHDMIDESPEAQTARDLARKRCDEEEVWEAVDTHKKAMEAKRRDMPTALRAAQYVLRESKQSPYYREESKSTQPEQSAMVVGDLAEVIQSVPPAVIEAMGGMSDEQKAEVEAFMVEMKRKQLAEAKD